MTHPSYTVMVIWIWESRISGSHIFVLCQKLKLLKKNLKQLNREAFFDLSSHTTSARSSLNSTQEAIAIDLSNMDLKIIEKELL